MTSVTPAARATRIAILAAVALHSGCTGGGATSPSGTPTGAAGTIAASPPATKQPSSAPEPEPIEPGAVEPQPPLELAWRGVDPENASWTSHVAIDAEGRIWTGAVEANEYWIFDRDGNLVDTWNPGTRNDGMGHFGGIAFGPNELIHIVDSSSRRILTFDRDRNPVAAWGAFGTADDRLVVPNKIATDSRGDVYVHDDELLVVKQFTAQGQFIRTVAQGSYPSMHIDDGGHVHAVIGPDKVLKKFAPDGTVVRAIDVREITEFPIGIVVDAAGFTWLGSTYDYPGRSEAHGLLRFDPQGKLANVWQNIPVEEFAIDPAGDRIYVSFIGQEYLAAYEIPVE